MGARMAVEVLAIAGDTISVRCAGGNLPAKGMGGDLEFAGAHGIVCYHVHVISDPHDADGSLVLQRAASVTRKQRRKSWRVPMHLDTELLRENDQRPYNAMVLNLSAEGAMIETDAPLRMGEPVELCLSLQGGTLFWAVCKAVRTEGDSEGWKQRFGLLFVSMPEKGRSIMTHYLWKQLRKLYPKQVRAQFPGISKRREMQRRMKRPPWVEKG